jgi:DegV family protein with EDD domain
MIKVVMDSGGDLPAKLLKVLDISVVPINIHFRDGVYKDRIDIDSKGFYQRVEAEKAIPKTAQPSPYQFAEAYREVARKSGATDIISVNITSQLSGTHASSMLAAQEVADEVRVHPFDSRSGSGGQGLMVLEAARMAADKIDVEKILERLVYMRENMSVFFVLDNLKFAQMSGRVGAVAATLGSLLRIKPVLYVQDGMVEMAERVRTSKRALDSMVAMVKERIGDELANVVVIHAEAPEVAQALVQRVQSEFRIRELFVEKLSLALAVHLGPGTVGLVACPAE